MRPKSIITAVLFGGASLVQAAEQAAPIIVTATRTAQTADATLTSVTVIGREEIEASHSNNLMELLQSRSVGLDVSRNGGPGSTTSLFLRGSEADHVLVLIDGVRVASVTTGAFDWTTISPEQIERIEIVRGPNSTLYGSDAIGGVIQIFTHRQEGLSASLTAGSYHTAKAALSTGGRLGAGRYHLNLSHHQDEGFSTTAPEAGRYEADRDGYRKASASAGFSLPLGERLELGLDLFHSEATAEYDDAPYVGAEADTRLNSGKLRLDWQTSAIWQQHLALSASREYYESRDSWPAKITSQRRGANWQHDLSLGDSSLLSLGLDLQHDAGEIEGSYDEAIDNRAAYLQYQWAGERFDLLLGARKDEHSEYGGNATHRLTLGTRLGPGRLYAGHATAFKAPTFNELYYPFYGNPDIEPEESATTELGYRLGRFQASVYQSRVKNLISSDPITWQAVNIGKARIKGLELEYRQPVGSWQLETGLTLQSAEDEQTDEPLLRRAEKKLFVNAGGPLGPKARLGIEASYTGPRMDFGDVELASYTLLNLSGDYRLSPAWSLGARVENLLDEHYQLADGYNSPELSAYLTLNYQPSR